MTKQMFEELEINLDSIKKSLQQANAVYLQFDAEIHAFWALKEPHPEQLFVAWENARLGVCALNVEYERLMRKIARHYQALQVGR